MVGIQRRNAWTSYGGRCYLVAPEHLRYAGEEEAIMLEPELQKALQAFRSAPEVSSYDDLTMQQGPTGPDEGDGITQDSTVLAFLENLQNPGWTQFGDAVVKVTHDARALEAINYNRVGHYKPVRVSIVRDGTSWMVASIDRMRELKVQRAAIRVLPVLVSMFYAEVPEWAENSLQSGPEFDVVKLSGNGENIETEEPSPEPPPEMRVRCHIPGWHDDYEIGPFLVSHGATHFKTPVPRYAAKAVED